MPVTAIVGAQWGDEGKGKITDLLAQSANLVIRFGGGANAGHTVVNDLGEFRLHLIPSGIFNSQSTCLIGTGALIDFTALADESKQLEAAGVPMNGLKISSRSHIVMPYHLRLDRLADEARGGDPIGTTRRGVGPAYVDRAERVGIQAGDLLDDDALERKLRFNVERKNLLLTSLYAAEPVDLGHLRAAAEMWRDRYGGLIVDQVDVVGRALAQDLSILLEGQLGTMRDLDWGIYPYVTSSTTVAGGGAVGGGIPVSYIDQVLGVIKAYTTAVGAGPLPTELEGEFGDMLRRRGDEFGATTGRPRRVGWFDGVAARYAHQLNGFTGLAVTKLDVLDGLESVKICTAYTVDGRYYDHVPATPKFTRAIPVYEVMPGWADPTSGARSLSDLPSNARRYLDRIEELVGAPITMISVGRDRRDTILVNNL